MFGASYGRFGVSGRRECGLSDPAGQGCWALVLVGARTPRPVGGFGGGRLGHGLSQGPGVTASPGGESAQQRAAVILTPDQRVRVFISSTLEELAEERAAARRAIRAAASGAGVV